MKTLMMSLLLLAALGSTSAFASDCGVATGNNETRQQQLKKDEILARLNLDTKKPRTKSADGKVIQ